MRTIIIDNDLPQQEPCVATIGFFDGVHRGHRYLIGKIIDEARRQSVEAMVITFSNHPRRVLHTQFQPQLLTTNAEKQQLLAATGIDCCAILPFDETMAAMSAHDFIRDILHKKLNVCTLFIGYDNRFGHNRAEGFDDYVRYGREWGIDVRHVGVAGDHEGRPYIVSSSSIRRLLAAGDVSAAAECLGTPYSMSGIVIHGVQKGRKMGFPTANIRPTNADKIVPANGVYAVRVLLEGENTPRKGIMNIGTRPTFDDGEVSMEIHIFGFEGDIYGQSIGVSFIDRLRDERRFTSTDELARQIEEDKRNAENYLI